MENGKIFNSATDYHTGPGYSRSDLELIRKSSFAHYEYKKNNPEDPTPAMALGTAFHELVLEPIKFYDYNTTNCNKPIKPNFGRSKSDLAAKSDWENTVLHQWEKTVEGKKLWKKEEWDRLHAMKDSVLKNPIMNRILSSNSTEMEMSYYYNQDGILLKARPDIYFPEMNLIVDLKTTYDATYNQFRKDLVNYSYDAQSAFYSDIVSKIERTNKVSFFFCCVEKEAPHGVALYQLDEPSQEVGRELYQAGIKKLKDPGKTYPEYIQTINIASYGFDVDNR